jgi:hypothetical protein
MKMLSIKCPRTNLVMKEADARAGLKRTLPLWEVVALVGRLSRHGRLCQPPAQRVEAMST